MENVAKVFVLFPCGVQLLLRSGVLTVLDLDSRWMSRQVLLRSLGRCCLGLVAVLVAGGAAEVLPVFLNCSLPLRRTHPPAVVCCFRVYAEIGVTNTISGRCILARREVQRIPTQKLDRDYVVFTTDPQVVMYRLLCALRQRIEDTKAEREERKNFTIENKGDIPMMNMMESPVQQQQQQQQQQEQQKRDEQQEQ